MSSERKEWPLCLSYLNYSDYHFYPCKCGFQICTFCFDKIKENSINKCPNCKHSYDVNARDRRGSQYYPSNDTCKINNSNYD